MTLRQTIIEEIRKDYPEIYSANNNKLEKFKFRISKIGFLPILIIYVTLIILVGLYSAFLNYNSLKLLTINFDDNIKSFSTSIITLVSMNLFVTNLLLTHLKDERDDLQTIIDKKVNFKFITYLGFTIILSILSLYFLSPSILNVDIKSNILILIFTTFIFYILQLINLYNAVFNFLNKSKRSEIIANELDSEFYRAFYNNYLKAEFKKRYNYFIENNHGFTKYFSFSHAQLNLENKFLRSSTNSYLIDVKTDSFKTVLDNITDENKFYVPLELDMKLEKNEQKNILYFSNKRNEKFSKYYVLSQKQYLQNEIEDDNLKKLLKKIQNNTLNNKFADLKDNLDNLDRVYSKYLSLQKN